MDIKKVSISPETTVALCMPIKQSVHALTLESILGTKRDFLGAGGLKHINCIGRWIVHARNILTSSALNWRASDYTSPKQQVTHVLFADADMVWEPDALFRLLSHNLPIVGGLCFLRYPPFPPTLGRYFKDDRPRSNELGWIYDYPKNKLVEVDVTGGGFLLIKREVFDAIKTKYGKGDPNWADWWSVLPDFKQGEDFSWCDKARSCGIKIYVDTGVKIGHVGEFVIDDRFAEKNRERLIDQWVETTPLVKEGAPLASIVIPTYNTNPELLQKAIWDSARQTVPVEVIVVDDGSEILAETGLDVPKNVRFIHHSKNMGGAAALNTGIQNIKTDWFCWLSADDRIEITKVQKQLEELNCKNMLVGAHSYTISSEFGHIKTIHTPKLTDINEQKQILRWNCIINGSTVMINKTVLEHVKLHNGDYFDTSFLWAYDWDLWNRIGRKYEWLMHDEVLGDRFEGETGTSAINKSPEKKTIQSLENQRIVEKYANEEEKEDAQTLGQLAGALIDGGYVEKAYRIATQSVELRQNVYANLVLSKYYWMVGDMDKLEESFRALPESVTDSPAMKYNRALMLLTQKKADGFKGLKNRWDDPASMAHEAHLQPLRKSSVPVWNGENLNGKRIFLYSDQGFGDAIQFSRFIKPLMESGAKIKIAVAEPLVSLFKIAFGDSVTKLKDYKTLVGADYQAALMDLPGILETTFGAIPKFKIELPKAPKANKFKIGYCYQGNKSQANDRNRSIPKELFSILSMPEIDLVSVQYEDLLPGCDFLYQAKVMSALDLIVTIDTVTAHLAGTLGMNVWTLLPSIGCDWRWGATGETTEWYPSMRLVRQQKNESWAETLKRVKLEIKYYIKSE